MVDQAMGVEVKYSLSDCAVEAYRTASAPAEEPAEGRPTDRKAMTAILYLLRTGCQWRPLPRSLGAGTTVHDRFQQWVEAGVFRSMWKAGFLHLGKNLSRYWNRTFMKTPTGTGRTSRHTRRWRK